MAIELKEIGPARQAALSALARVREGALVNEAVSGGRRLGPKDRALMTTLVYGVLRQQRYLDAWIRPLLRGPLDPTVEDILRLAFFQLGFLDRVPAYAVVYAAVEQTKQLRPRAASMVNAILRRGQGSPPQNLSLGERYSAPDWVVERWAGRYGDRLEAILAENNRVPPLTLRVNLHRTSRDAVLAELERSGVPAQPSAYVPEAIRVTGSLWLEDFRPFQQGLVTVQDESGMLVGWILDARPGDQVLDMASGLGGKAIHTVERTEGRIHMTALDISPGRLQRLAENLRRMGYEEVVTIRETAAERYAPTHSGMFDRIILDAPCSGLGVLRRRVDARYKKRPEDIGRFRDQQTLLLEAAWRAAKPGAVIVYSTCSTEPEETHEVVRAVCARHPDLRVEDVSRFLPHEALKAYVEARCLVLAPGDVGMDGFFIARLKVAGGEPGKDEVEA